MLRHCEMVPLSVSSDVKTISANLQVQQPPHLLQLLLTFSTLRCFAIVRWYLEFTKYNNTSSMMTRVSLHFPLLPSSRICLKGPVCTMVLMDELGWREEIQLQSGH